MPFSQLEDPLHSVATAVTGFAFAVGVTVVALQRWRGGGGWRVIDVTTVTASVALPLAMASATGSPAGSSGPCSSSPTSGTAWKWPSHGLAGHMTPQASSHIGRLHHREDGREEQHSARASVLPKHPAPRLAEQFGPSRGSQVVTDHHGLQMRAPFERPDERPPGNARLDERLASGLDGRKRPLLPPARLATTLAAVRTLAEGPRMRECATRDFMFRRRSGYARLDGAEPAIESRFSSR